MKNETRLLLYTLAAIVLFFSGLSILSSSIQSDVMKCVIHMGIGIGLLGISCATFEEEQFEEVSKVPFLLSLLSFFITYLFIGRQGLFGNAFSLSGELSHYFVASLWLVLALLSSLMVIRYKEYFFIYIIVISLLLFISSLMTIFVHSNLLILVIISILLGITHFIKNTTVQQFGKYVSLGLMLFTCLFFTSEENVMWLFILSFVHIINMFIILYQDSSDECQIFTLLILSIYFICLYTNQIVESKVFLLLLTMGISIVEICSNCFSLFKNSILKKMMKFLCTIGYFLILYSVKSGKALAAILVLMVITSVVNLLLFKHDENEKNVIAIKGFVSILALANLFFPKILDSYLLFVIIDIFVLLLAFIGSKKNMKQHIKVLTFILSLILVFHDFENIQFIVTALTIIINYLFFTLGQKEEIEHTRNRDYFITLGFFFILLEQYPCNLAYLVLSCLLLILCALHYENRLFMGITIPFIVMIIIEYIGGIFALPSVTLVAEYLLFYTFAFLFALKVVKKSKVAWLNLLFVFLSICCLGEDTFMTSLLVLLVSVFLFFQAKEAGSSKAFSIVFGILSLLNLADYFEGLGAFLLLLILGISLLLSVFKSSKSMEKEEIKEKSASFVNKKEPHYCGYCGGTLNLGDKFCGNCGKRVER